MCWVVAYSTVGLCGLTQNLQIPSWVATPNHVFYLFGNLLADLL